MARMPRNYGHGPRKRLWPMPIEAIYDHPKLRNAPSVVYGSVMRILHHFWVCDCAPLPEATRELESIGRMTEHLWRNHGDLIMEVVGDVMPSMILYHEARVSRATNLQKLSMRAAGKRALTAAAKSEGEARKRMGANDTMIVKRSKRIDVAPPTLPPVVPSTTGRKRMVDHF